MPQQDFFDLLLNDIKEGLKQVYKENQITLAKVQKLQYIQLLFDGLKVDVKKYFKMRAQGLLQQLTA